MYDPFDPKHKDEFGSELERRQSPELAARSRKNSIYGSLIGLGAGIWLLVDGIDATRTGELVKGSRKMIDLPGPLAIALGLAVIAGFGWLLWISVRGRRGKGVN